jgi:hypothetical protein
LKKTIEDQDLEHMLNFIGYGRLDADIWFLGFEETGGDEKSLRGRLKFQQVEDCAEAQSILGLSQQQFGEENLQGAWRGMCEIMLKLDGKESTTENIQEYQSEHLGRASGSTLLSVLLPIPLPVGSAWGYETLLPQYASRQAYYAAVKPLRFELFNQLLSQHLPKIIIAYGQSAWPEYQELFGDFKLSPHGQFMVGWDANTVVILSNHFSDGSMSGKFDEIVTLILENSLSIETAKPTGPVPLSKAELARQKKEAAKKVSAAKRKPSAQHNPADPYCVCAYCLGYENS